jgi:hypothetical protein
LHTIVPSDGEEPLLYFKDSLLTENQFVYSTPKLTSRQSIYGKPAGQPGLLMDLMMPPLGEAVAAVSIPPLMPNPRLKRREGK